MYIKTDINNLKLIIDKIDLLFINQQNDYLIDFEKIKMRLFKILRQSIFRDLIEYVILYALQKIYTKYKALTNVSNVFFRCSKTYTIKSDLLCNYVISKLMFNFSDVLKLKNVHSHWKFVKEKMKRVVIKNHVSNFSDDFYHL